MQRSRFRFNAPAALLVSIAAMSPHGAQAAPAARVDFAIGDVAAVNKAGQSRALTKGAQVEEGETINTNAGRAQLRFTDGAYVSLQPQSEFRIDQYRYEGKQDGSERTFVSLLKGGLRTITGFVGRSNKKNYQVNTAVATIGIRGTEYTIQYGESISGTVGEGEIEVCNAAGCIGVTDGESYYVPSQDLKPQLSMKGTDLPPDPPTPPQALIREVQRVSATGVDCLVDPAGCPVAGVLTGTQALDTAKVLFLTGTATQTVTPGTVVFDASGTLVDFLGVKPATILMQGNDGIVSWGMFTDASRSGALTHFFAGVPVPTADLAALGGTTGTYSLFDATPVTDLLNNQIGTLDSALVTIAFGTASTIGVDLNWTINKLPVGASLTGTGQAASFGASGSCGTLCTVNVSVVVLGANASRAGMVYDISDQVLGTGIGAAVLKPGAGSVSRVAQ